MPQAIALPAPEFTHALITELATGLHKVFSGDELLALYLGGSLALGGFDPTTSDLDFIVVTAGEVAGAQLTLLKDMHSRLWQANRNRLYRLCEGDYLTRAQAQHPAAGIVAPHLGRDGHFAVEEHGSELVIDLWKVRRAGFTVFGPPPQELIGAISDETMLAAKVALFKGWWQPKLERREPMGAGYQVYAVLTMARMYYGLRMRGEVSKREAAEWAADACPEYAGLFNEAVLWQPGNSFDHQQDVYRLIAYLRDAIAVHDARVEA